MPAVNEKRAFLESVGLFAETDPETLAEINALLGTVELRAGETLFEKGEYGDCLYVIAEGRVRIHDGDMTVSFLESGEVFGEMALLDAQPRVASITAVTETRLYRLDQVPFFELMQRHPEVPLGICRVLTRRMRERLRDKLEDYQYLQLVARLTSAAVALEQGEYDAHTLDEVAEIEDPLGHLARVFQRMAREVQAREEQLKRQVQELRIEIDRTKQAKKVSEITESDYFKSLRGQAESLRRIMANDEPTDR